MIPSDHFVRFYNEVFKALDALGHEHLAAYWADIGRQMIAKLGERFRRGGIKACREYWERIRIEENCVMDLRLTEDYLELHMRRCPSLSKALDNDAGACVYYCDHCPGWVVPVMAYAGLSYVKDIGDRATPECRTRIYEDRSKAESFARERGRQVLPRGEETRDRQ